MRYLLADRWHQGWLAAWFAVALVWVGDAATGVLQPLARAWSEQTQSAVAVHAAPELVLIAIDDASLGEFGAWPWPRERYAQLIDRLTAAGVQLAVPTVPFIGPESQQALAQLQRIEQVMHTDPQLADHAQLLGLVQQSRTLLDGDSQLSFSVAQSRRVVLAVRGPDTSSAWPLAQLSAGALGIGHAFFMPDADGMVRRHALQIDLDDRRVPSLALWAAAAVEGHRPADAAQRSGELWLGQAHWPVDRHGSVRPLWRPTAQMPLVRYAAAAVLADKVPAARLSGKIALIGPTAMAAAMPLQFAGAGSLTPLEALAQASSALLTRQLVTRPPWADLFNAALMVLVSLYLVLWVPRLAGMSAMALSVLIAVLLLSFSHLVMTQTLVELPVIAPLVALLCGHAAWRAARRDTAAVAARSAWQSDSRWGGGEPTTEPASLSRTFDLRSDARLDEDAALDTLPSALAALPTEPSALAIALADLPTLTRTPRPATAPQPPAQAPSRAGRKTVPAPLSAPPGPRDTKPSRAHRLPRLGDFQLEHEIGRGAMGRVYLAHTVATGERLAIKTLALAREFEGFALREARTRFQREALAALRLRHPDIVQVIDAGEDQGYAWIAMELLRGHDLVRYTQPHNLLPVPEVLEICARVAGALVHAHAQGVIHRDIKPANVMYEASIGAVKVTDFGIARITDAARTRTGLVLGSPSYMSPEHLAGGSVDGRSDLYSLGVLLFQLLTGALPVQGHSMAELMHAVARTPAPDVRTLRPRLPEAVANIVALALEKRAELRYPDAQQMEADLRMVRGLWGTVEPRPSAHTSSHRTVQEVAAPTEAQPARAEADDRLRHNQPG